MCSNIVNQVYQVSSRSIFMCILWWYASVVNVKKSGWFYSFSYIINITTKLLISFYLQVVAACAILHNICIGVGDLLEDGDVPQDNNQPLRGNNDDSRSGAAWIMTTFSGKFNKHKSRKMLMYFLQQLYLCVTSLMCTNHTIATLINCIAFVNSWLLFCFFVCPQSWILIQRLFSFFFFRVKVTCDFFVFFS